MVLRRQACITVLCSCDTDVAVIRRATHALYHLHATSRCCCRRSITTCAAACMVRDEFRRRPLLAHLRACGHCAESANQKRRVCGACSKHGSSIFAASRWGVPRGAGLLRYHAPSSCCCVCCGISCSEVAARVESLGQDLSVLSAAHLDIAATTAGTAPTPKVDKC